MKTVIITGASRGIGFAVAKKFLNEGWQVVGTSTSGNINPEFDRLIAFPLDLSKPESIKSFSAKVRELLPHIDVLVNNAGIHLEDDYEKKLSFDSLRQTLEVNLIGTADLTEQLLGLVIPDGHIINVSSMAGGFSGDQLTDGYYPAYRISKAALNMYTYTLAGRLKGAKVTVSSLDPGWVKTDMGGEEADRSPEEAARDVYNLAIQNVPSGKFWLDGKERGW
jgi:NAD(P)-dependent dehydrogenase (short-subunit alcohol dehydrogenase family)